MSLELEKSMRIINDLVSFCYYEGAEEFTMTLKHNANESTMMVVTACIENLDPRVLEKIRHVLSLPRQHEVEQNYWELSGETEFSAELSLIGAMTDKVEVEYEGGVLQIRVWRDD